MGQNKINMQKKIQDRKSLLVSFYKRKMGILRKLMQLSQLCDKQIVAAIYDPVSNQMIQYQSHEEFTLKHADELIKDSEKETELLAKKHLIKDIDPIKMQPVIFKFTNQDYEDLTKKHLPKSLHSSQIENTKDETVEIKCQDAEPSISKF